MTATEPLRDGESQQLIDLAEVLRGLGRELSDIAHKGNTMGVNDAEIARAAELETSLETAVLNIPARLAPYLSYALALAE